jgi:hypothetical protein
MQACGLYNLKFNNYKNRINYLLLLCFIFIDDTELSKANLKDKKYLEKSSIYKLDTCEEAKQTI